MNPEEAEANWKSFSYRQRGHRLAISITSFAFASSMVVVGGCLPHALGPF